jgi:3-dehydroquinate synthase
LLPQPRVVVLTNPVVASLWLAALRESLAAAGIASESIVVPDGEASKSWPTLQDVLTQLLEQKAERATTLVALGGGVVGDIAGFAAAIYQRGMPSSKCRRRCSRRSIRRSAERPASTTRWART